MTCDMTCDMAHINDMAHIIPEKQKLLQVPIKL